MHFAVSTLILMTIIAKFNIPAILVAPLDWGLGHATRCIPIVKALLLNDCRVIIACNTLQKKIFEQEFTKIDFLPLEGYNITYTKHPKLLAVSILRQLPSIVKVIKKENSWLKKIIDTHQIDLVISDNRYGLYTDKVPCIFITHQLQIKAPLPFIEKILQKINYQYINKYTACWVPDFKDHRNIAGTLSHPQKLPTVPVTYIGPLCRFETEKEITLKYDLCISLSGPEPQRTVLENQILQEIHTISGNIILVRGLPNNNETLVLPQNIMVINYLSGTHLGKVFQQSEIVISRSGYSTIMEIISLQKKAILIATPGQTEQVYLAKKLMQQGWCYSVNQADFNLQQALDNSKSFNYQLPTTSPSSLNQFITDFLRKIFK